MLLYIQLINWCCWEFDESTGVSENLLNQPGSQRIWWINWHDGGADLSTKHQLHTELSWRKLSITVSTEKEGFQEMGYSDIQDNLFRNKYGGNQNSDKTVQWMTVNHLKIRWKAFFDKRPHAWCSVHFSVLVTIMIIAFHIIVTATVIIQSSLNRGNI